MIALGRPKTPLLVEMVMCAGGIEDHVTDLEWDERFPLPPEGTRILSLCNDHNPSRLIARHNKTGELYFMSYSSQGYQWQPEFS